ncbi:MAG: hypothetical protein ACLUFV_12650 [Acutalibacteraceae bacterium]
MELHFQNPGFDYMLEQILAFQDEDASPSGPRRSIASIATEPARTLPRPARLEAIARELRSVYAAQEQTIHEKTRAYAAHWQRCKPQVTAALSDAFSLDAAGLFNDLRVCLSLNPIEPRCLREHRFDLFYLNSPQGAVGAALHEIIHFLHFYVWDGLFDDPPDACEAPALPWLLSEMVVEPIMRDERLRSINPYFERENGGCVYPYFYDMTLDGRPLLDTLYEMYRTQPIDAFMRKATPFSKRTKTPSAPISAARSEAAT